MTPKAPNLFPVAPPQIYAFGNYCLKQVPVSIHSNYVLFSVSLEHGRDRIVVSTLRCGRNNPGSNPGHGIFLVFAH